MNNELLVRIKGYAQSEIKNIFLMCNINATIMIIINLTFLSFYFSKLTRITFLFSFTLSYLITVCSCFSCTYFFILGEILFSTRKLVLILFWRRINKLP